MKHQDRRSFVTDDQTEQMDADMALQPMLMMLFHVVSFAGLRYLVNYIARVR